LLPLSNILHETIKFGIERTKTYLRKTWIEAMYSNCNSIRWLFIQYWDKNCHLKNWVYIHAPRSNINRELTTYVPPETVLEQFLTRGVSWALP
jgi:hypothetical protein